ncbi:hypothetical protein ACFQ08_03270 [Streptosporangium algeriense]|uniref:Uncharacterized protein n=1 Tax=Streptosporangium algeriense TaxID=1682748 RepID=A0ABW3DLG3_9ACTN
MSGLLVGAVFGAVFVFVNARSPLDDVVVTVLRVLASLAVAAMLALWFVAVRRPAEEGSPGETGEDRRGGMFGRGYLIVVAVEVLLLFGGLRVLAALDVPAEVNVAWVAIVVGVHFVALAPVWKDRVIAVPGAALTLLGIAGFLMAWAGSLLWVPVVSGVASGAVLLTGCLTSGLWLARPRTDPAETAQVLPAPDGTAATARR